MRNYVTESAMIIGLIGLFLAGTGETSARADDHDRYIPNDHRPLTFKNADGALHGKADRWTRHIQQRSTSDHSHPHAQGTPSTDPPAERHNVAEPSAENKALICPVTGDKIASVKDAIGQSTYKGKTYYFCCDGCKPRFDKAPAKFVKNAAAHKYQKM